MNNRIVITLLLLVAGCAGMRDHPPEPDADSGLYSHPIDTLPREGDFVVLADGTRVRVVPGEPSIFVTGAVAKPGRYPLVTGMTLAHAIAGAGGSSEIRSTTRVKIMRGSVSHRALLEDNQDFPLKNGDVIFVPGRSQTKD